MGAFVVGLILLNSLVHADAIWSGEKQAIQSLDLWTHELQKGAVILLGELHATEDNQNDPETIRHHERQVQILNSLRTAGHRVSVGMEFFEYPGQTAVDAYLSNEMNEPEFLLTVGWGASPFYLYREQVRAPLLSGGTTWALNIPRRISRQVALGGPDSLTDEMRALLPPVWEWGNDLYFERFRKIMEGHVPHKSLVQYFWAQSLWDDTMAWRIQRFRQKFPNQTLVVIVGEFHVEFDIGLANRLREQGVEGVQSLLQIPSNQLAEQRDERYGNRAQNYFLIESSKPTARRSIIMRSPR